MSAPRPIAEGKEIKLDPKRYIVSKTDVLGKIVYCNQYFCEISGYSERELVGSPHNIVRHPDMPKAIFYLMWQRLRKGQNIMAVVKNRAKNGDYYRVATDFEIKKGRHGKVRHYIAFRQAAPKHAVNNIEPLYARLRKIEEEEGIRASVAYIELFLAQKGMDYDRFIEDIAKPKGLSALLFAKMKTLFR